MSDDPKRLAIPTGRPDPLGVTSVAEFTQMLRRLRIWAGNPSFSALAKRAGLARTTVHDALRPERTTLPAIELVRRVVIACGATPAEAAGWEAAWRSVRERLAEAAPQRRAGAVPRQLPAAPNGFAGRAAERESLDAILNEWGDATPPVATIAIICGPGGVGKTSLAMHWSHRVIERFPGGQLYLNLGGFSDRPRLTGPHALAILLAGLGVPHDEIPAEPVALEMLYRSQLAGRRMLIVLDNADDVEQLRPLLPGDSACLTLITSRNALGGLVAREGARRLRLAPLDDTEALELLSWSLGAERVAGDRGAAIRLARLCGHLPLALRIAAANLTDRPFWTIGGYADELEAGDRLTALAAPGDEANSIDAVLRASYEKLDGQGRVLLRRLGLVPGTCFSESVAAALLDTREADATPFLEALTSAHLVESFAPHRFALHDLVRLFAARLAEDQEQDPTAVLTLLLRWYLETTINAVNVLRPNLIRLPDQTAQPPAPATLSFSDTAHARAWLDSELDNLVDTIAVAAQHHRTRCYAWLLTDALRGYFTLRAPLVQWLAAAEAGLQAARQAGEVAAEAAMLACLGDAARAVDDYPAAIAHFTAALELASRTGDRQRAAALTSNLGLTHLEAGQLDSAERWLTEAVAAYRALDDSARAATGLARLGALHRDLGQLETAEEYLRQAVSWHEHSGDEYQYADAVARLGIVLRHRGNLGEAAQCAATARDIYLKVGDRTGIVCTTEDLAAALVESGDPRSAIRLCEEALKLVRELDDRRVESDLLSTLATAQDAAGVPGAADHAREALELARRHGHGRSEVAALLALSRIRLREGDAGEAGSLATEAFNVCRSAGLRLFEGVCLTALGWAELAAGDTAQAVATAELALAAHEKSGQSLARMRAIVLLEQADPSRQTA